MTPIPATFSFTILLTLLVMLLASGRVFHLLTLQWTSQRPIQAMREWARDRQFRLQLPPVELPTALQGLASIDPQVELLLRRGPEMLVRLTTAARPAAQRPVWHLLIRETGAGRNPAALRPAGPPIVFADLFSLTGYPSLLPPERFVVFARESRDARQIAQSPARGLLPPDIGLLLHGPYITLDFSTRPFDSIEFDRMIAVMNQVTGAMGSA